MTDEVNITDLITEYNDLATKLGRDHVNSFKTIEAAQAAVLKLKTLLGQGTTMSDAAISQEFGTPPFTPDAVPSDGSTQPAATSAAMDPTVIAAMAAVAATPSGTNSAMNTVNRRGPTQGVGAFCKELIIAGKTNAEILAAVAVKFNGTAKTSGSCIAFYRNALKGGAASRPRPGKTDIASMEARAKALLANIAAAKAAAAAQATQTVVQAPLGPEATPPSTPQDQGQQPAA